MTTTRRRARKLPVPAEGRELRVSSFGNLEVREPTSADGPIGFRGLAAVFDQRAQIGGKYGWIEEIKPGAFSGVLEDDVRLLKNHNPDLILARTTAGNLRLAQTDEGLEVDADMTPTTYARDLALSLAAGDVNQMSFAFEVAADMWTELPEDDPDYGKTAYNELRTIYAFKTLYDVSPVTYPAYPDTEAALRMRELRALAEGLGLDDEGIHELASEIRSGRLDLRALLARVSDHGRKTDDGDSCALGDASPSAGPARGGESTMQTGAVLERIRHLRRKAGSHTCQR